MGMLLGILWTRTKNLLTAILVHALVNALAMMTTIKIGIG